ncbi:exodeoxyribonuclease V subunit alpha [Pseudonocardia sp.]|uniref:exodeoxyribonuclease V subunit alpha n=1 Tax=Pseudonocardia sp. TaxID=60912 RepID=UPI003D0C17E3
MTAPAPGLDPHDPRVVRGSDGLLARFNAAGVLAAADVHVATRLGRLGGETDETVLLAAALAVRAVRHGSVCVDLDEVGTTVLGEGDELVDVSALPWPDPRAWRAACLAGPLVSAEPAAGVAPLRMPGRLLYLDRYWRQEEQVRVELRERAAAEPPRIDVDRLRAGLERLFVTEGPDRQRLAAAVAALRRVTVLAGGPGTGKTTTVARLLALLRDQPGPPPRIALAAPTGKAAARLAEAVRDQVRQLPDADRERLGDLPASTLHRLLGFRPGHTNRFHHDRTNRLPHDVVVVDETSMVSLTMMARLLEAVRPDARLVLVGDPDQLASVEAGAVLGDLARAPGAVEPALDSTLRSLGTLAPDDAPIVHGVVTLDRTWRFGAEIAALARAIRDGDADAAVAALRAGEGGSGAAGAVEFVEAPTLELRDPPGLDAVRAEVVAANATLVAHARAGDVDKALEALDRHRLLCAHRRGPYGVTRWGWEVERWLADAGVGPGAGDGEWFPGRAVLVTTNDYDLNLYNGDTGVLVREDGRTRAVFGRGGAPLRVATARLSQPQGVHAMTVHRAQGSQFSQVTVVLPPPESPLLTRELLYTAVTRAIERVRVVGSEAAVRAAVARPVGRASGLRDRLGT